MLNRRALLGATAALALMPRESKAWLHHGAPASVSGLVTWNNVVINGGGTMPAFSFANDGTKIVRTDISGSYKFNGTKWNQINSEIQLPYPANAGYRELYGISDIQICAGNSQYIYVIITDAFYNGSTFPAAGVMIYRSSDGGTSFVRTNYWNVNFAPAFDPTANASSGPYKQFTKKIGVDPANPLVVYAANPGGVPQVTSNGLDFTSVPNLPSASSGILGASCWDFDPTHGTTTATVSGRSVTVTAYIYVAIEGSGVWQSKDGGASFTQISTTVGKYMAHYCAVDPNGLYYIADADIAGRGTCGRFCIFTPGSPGSWQEPAYTSLDVPYAGYFGRLNLAVHPTVPGLVCWIQSSDDNHHLYYSTDYGATHVYHPRPGQGSNAEQWVVGDAPWFAHQMGGPPTAFNLGSSNLAFDPASTNDLWISIGQGLGKTTLSGSPPAFPTNPVWTPVLNGIENAVCNDLNHESGGPLLQVMADINGFVRTPTTTAGASSDQSTLVTSPLDMVNQGDGGYGPLLRGAGYTAAVDPYNPAHMVWISDQNSSYNVPGYSLDGGTTWTPFVTQPPVGPEATQIGSLPGNVILSNGVILWLCGYFWSRSTDWGTTWTVLDQRISGMENIPQTPPDMPITGYIDDNSSPGTYSGVAGTVLTVTAQVAPVPVGSKVYSNPVASILAGTAITSYGTGNGYGPGTYNINNSQTVASFVGFIDGGSTAYDQTKRYKITGSIAGTVLTITAITTLPAPAGAAPVGVVIINAAFNASLARVLSYGTGDGTGKPGTYNLSSSHATAPGTLYFEDRNFEIGWGSTALSVPSHTGSADRVNTNKIYIYNHLYGNTPDVKGIFKSADAGLTWTYQGSPNSDPQTGNSIGANYIKAVPGHEDWVFASAGYVSSRGSSAPQGQSYFKKSTNGGSTWTAITGFQEVIFGFGKAGPSGNTTIFACGFYNGGSGPYTLGVWMSVDLGTTWTQMTSTAYGAWPIRNDAIQAVDGDKDVFGRVYIGFRGSGAVYSTPA